MINDLVVLPNPLVAKRDTACSVPVFAGVPEAVPVMVPVPLAMLKPAGRPFADQVGA